MPTVRKLATLSPTMPAIRGSVEMVARINAFDWAATSLGPIERWPQSLRTALSILLGSRFPMQMLWGPEYIHFYNDAYLPIAADKHPSALGRPGRQIWPEVWDTVGPMLDQVRATGEPTWSDDQLLVLERHGALEEGYFTFSYGPIQGDSGAVEGIFIAVTETTRRVIGARRLQALRDLGIGLAGVAQEAQVYAVAGEVLAHGPSDLPFALVYLVDQHHRLDLLQAIHVPAGHPAAPPVVPLDADSSSPWPLAAALADGQPLLAAAPSGGTPLPGGPWGVPAAEALLLPLLPPGALRPVGVLVAGVSPRLRLDDEYRTFLAQVADQIAAAVGTARSRAAVEAAVRIRDDFLSIAAHEFKNPLTPIIGRLQLLQRRLARASLDPRHIQDIQTLLGEARRLADMVDSLLDVSRLRSGQLNIKHQPVDLCALARRLAGEVQPILEIHSLDLQLAEQPVLVSGDPLRLEQVARNLVSNAVKYSPGGGEIRITVASAGERALLAVADHGLGIEPDMLPRLFEQYYRGDDGMQFASGIGVGLYVVHEIMRLHGGTISVDSTPGVGSTFTIGLPLLQQDAPR